MAVVKGDSYNKHYQAKEGSVAETIRRDNGDAGAKAAADLSEKQKEGQKGKMSVEPPAQHTPFNPGGSIPAPPSHGECLTAEFLHSSIAFIA